MIKLTNIKKTILTGVLAVAMMTSTLTALAADPQTDIPSVNKDGEVTFDVTQTWNINDANETMVNENVAYKITVDPTNNSSFKRQNKDGSYYYDGVSLTPTTFILNGSNTDEQTVSQTLTLNTTRAGVYSFLVQADSDKNTVKAGYTYDDTVYTIRAYVKRENGQLVTTITAQKGDSTDKKVANVSFGHTFKAASSKDPIDGKYDPPVKKMIKGDTPENKDTFTFQIVPHEDNPDAPNYALPRVENVEGVYETNDKVRVTPLDPEHSTAEFGEILFSALGTYQYDVVEVNDHKEGYTYDKTVYTVIYVVAEVDEVDEDGNPTGKKAWNITRTFERNGVSLENPLNEYDFSNTYRTPGGKKHEGGGPSGSAMIYKVDASGDDARLAGATFEVTKTNGDYVTTITTDESGMAPIDSIGVGMYRLKETKAPRGYQIEDRYIYFTVGKGSNSSNPSNVKITNTSRLVTDVQHIVAVKQWANVDGVTTPDSVTLELVKDGVAIGVTQIASAENNWTVDFGLIPADGTYEIVENNVAAEYAVSIERAQNDADVIYTITNTYIGDKAGDQNGAAGFTGDDSNMMLYAGVMGVAIVMLAGWFVVNRRRKDEE